MTAPFALHREAADLWIRWVSCLISTEEAGRHAKRLALSHDAMVREMVVPILQEWWDACRDAIDMLHWSARLVGSEDMDSPEGRRVTWLYCLCAGATLPDRDQHGDDMDRLVGHIATWVRGKSYADLAKAADLIRAACPGVPL